MENKLKNAIGTLKDVEDKLKEKENILLEVRQNVSNLNQKLEDS